MKNLLSCDLISAVCDNLIAVHIRLCTASGLPYSKWEMVHQLAANYIVCRLADDVLSFLIQFTKIEICNCSTLL